MSVANWAWGPPQVLDQPGALKETLKVLPPGLNALVDVGSPNHKYMRDDGGMGTSAHFPNFDF